MAPSHSKSLPLIALASDTVLLPGIIIRIPLAGRPDILALLAQVYNKPGRNKARSNSTDSTAIGCVPIKSPLLNSSGQSLIEGSAVGAATADPDSAPSIDPSNAGKEDLFGFGTAAKIYGLEGKDGGKGDLALLVEGVSRFRIDRITQEQPYPEAEVTYHTEETIAAADTKGQELFTQLKQLSRDLLTLLRLSSLLPRGPTPSISPFLARRLEVFVAKKEVDQAGILADFMCNLVETTAVEKLQILAAWGIDARLERVIEILKRQVEGIRGSVKIASLTSTSFPAGMDIDSLNKKQRDMLSRRNPLSALGLRSRSSDDRRDDGDEEPNEIDDLKRKLDDAGLTPEAQKVAQRELKRLRGMNPAQADYQVCRNYLENLAEIPWSRTTEDRLGPDTLVRARKQLDDDHYGLEKIKKRLLEYLAVLKLKQAINADIDAQTAKAAQDDASTKPTDEAGASPVEVKLGDTKVQILRSKRMVDKSPILLLVGPPGTGKTSLAKSVATALGREFHRISLGGVRDEAEIRGHRRTYVAAMPGLIVNGLKKVGVANPVILLDEIDKVSTSNFHGDPSAALLEVLDPEQNYTFTDHYINIPIDLSRVLFIATANSLDTIPAPLLDRMETIALSGYTTLEKRHIARRHLVPKQVATNGLKAEDVLLDEGDARQNHQFVHARIGRAQPRARDRLRLPGQGSAVRRCPGRCGDARLRAQSDRR